MHGRDHHVDSAQAHARNHHGRPHRRPRIRRALEIHTVVVVYASMNLLLLLLLLRRHHVYRRVMLAATLLKFTVIIIMLLPETWRQVSKD